MPSLVRRRADDPNNPYRVGQVVNGRQICGAKKMNGELCRTRPVSNMGRCDRHGGKSPVGAKHHNAASLMYSREVTNANIGERYAALLHDPELLSLRNEISLVTAYIQDRESLLRKGVTDDVWNELCQMWDIFYNAYLDGDEKRFRSAIDRINEIFEVSASESKPLTREVNMLLDQKRKLVTAQQKNDVLAQTMVSIDQTLTLLTAQMYAIREAAYLYTSKDEADQIIAHAQAAYKKITGESDDQKYLNLIEIDGKS